MHRLGSIFALVFVLGACQSSEAGPNADTNTETSSDTTAEDSASGGGPETRQPWIDEWETIAAGPAAELEHLSIGDRLTSDNFANRGDIEVYYVEDITDITIEMQRFTIGVMSHAQDAFDRMQPWLYDLAIPDPPGVLSPDDACWAPGTTGCYVRTYYDGFFQPVRDGANFRVTIPAGWAGSLELVTSDNLEEGIDRYPDRSDILVDGLAGSLEVDLDSGNVSVRLDPTLAHYAGCPNSLSCEDQGHTPGCGCTQPTTLSIENAADQASNMTVDVGSVEQWYTVLLDNRATLEPGNPVCEASIDCSAFADCELDPAYQALLGQERAEINYPGDPAISGAGIRIALISDGCAEIPYVNGPQDWDNPEMPIMQRGQLMLCAGCL